MGIGNYLAIPERYLAFYILKRPKGHFIREDFYT